MNVFTTKAAFYGVHFLLGWVVGGLFLASSNEEYVSRLVELVALSPCYVYIYRMYNS